MLTEPKQAGLLTITWERRFGVITYTLCRVHDDGQVGWVDSFEQGPFDTALEVAQWAWKAIARHVEPSHC